VRCVSIQQRRAEFVDGPVPRVVLGDACHNRSVRLPFAIYLSIGRLAPSSAPHLRRCGRLAAENKFSGTLPCGIAQMPSLRQLCAALREPWLLPCFEALALLCRDVRLNFLQGNVTTIARMNGARSFAVCRLPFATAAGAGAHFGPVPMRSPSLATVRIFATRVRATQALMHFMT
jgi:hypothetical protein